MSKAAPAPQPRLPAIRVDSLVKHYGRVQAVNGISLEVCPGEVVGLLGPNGAGKSTTIRCLLDLLHPTSGQLEILGLVPQRDGAAIRARVGYVPGELRLPERLRGRDIVASFGRLRGGLDTGRLDELETRLGADLSRPARTLSTGNRRKLALLLAFLWPTDVLILDEPTAGLDPLVEQTFQALVREARAEGAAILLSSHVLAEVQAVADRVVVLRQGRVVATGTVEELRQRARRRVEVWFAQTPPSVTALGEAGLADIAVEGRRVTASLAGAVQPVVELLAANPVTSLLLEEPGREEAFLDLYQEAAA
jgi:ABC-2 type transport system ATP-binding protein